MRHTYATLLLESGEELAVISRTLLADRDDGRHLLAPDAGDARAHRRRDGQHPDPPQESLRRLKVVRRVVRPTQRRPETRVSGPFTLRRGARPEGFEPPT